MDLDVFTDFFLGLFIRFANTFGFTSGIGNSDETDGNDCGQTNSDYCVHFFSAPKILALIARAQTGSGKCQPTNAPTAIQNMMSNMVFLLRFLGVAVATVHRKQVVA